MPRIRSVTAVAAVVLASACSASHVTSSKNNSARSIIPTQASTSSTTNERQVPDGTYRTVATRQEELAKHFDPSFITSMIGSDGRMPVTIKIVGGHWDLFDVLDDGTVDHGDEGTVSYDAQRRLVLTSESSGCTGCVVTYDWTFTGSNLTLIFRSELHGPAGDDRAVRVVTEHTYQKVG